MTSADERREPDPIYSGSNQFPCFEVRAIIFGSDEVFSFGEDTDALSIANLQQGVNAIEQIVWHSGSTHPRSSLGDSMIEISR